MKKEDCEAHSLIALAVGVGFGVLIGAALLASFYPVFQSKELAAWVQAFGSLAALGVAIWVFSKQAKLTRQIHENESKLRIERDEKNDDEKKRERERWCNSVVTILEKMAEQIFAIDRDAEADLRDVSSSIFQPIVSFRRSDFLASISALRSLPLTDLGSTDAVQGVMGLANEASLILEYMDANKLVPENVELETQRKVVSDLTVIRQSAHRAIYHFEKAVRGLGGEVRPDLSLMWF
ncbi:hypothetical protein [Alcaligenes faecalis]|uniref:hypothetical protein n=1 Tax=Alcaligenes faecalis TaxID=511 RepID=UPI002150517E|nr:hypothetical protein [Alcaligenes faecalis]MCR4144303.1 hypothetical protein [Alcaligenes faecalis]